MSISIQTERKFFMTPKNDRLSQQQKPGQQMQDPGSSQMEQQVNKSPAGHGARADAHRDPSGGNHLSGGGASLGKDPKAQDSTKRGGH
jgi:hypothetical protein